MVPQLIYEGPHNNSDRPYHLHKAARLVAIEATPGLTAAAHESLSERDYR